MELVEVLTKNNLDDIKDQTLMQGKVEDKET